MGTMDDAERVQVESRAELRAWLVAHHHETAGRWLVTFKKRCGDRHLPWADLVQELLCFGWIDSRRRGVDADRSMIWISPRKPGSIWSAVNKRHIAALRERGQMRPAGEAAVTRALGDGSWTMLDDIDAEVVPPDLQAAFDADPVAARGWPRLTSGNRREWLWLLKSAKRPKTRAARLDKALGAIRAAGEAPE